MPLCSVLAHYSLYGARNRLQDAIYFSLDGQSILDPKAVAWNIRRCAGRLVRWHSQHCYCCVYWHRRCAARHSFRGQYRDLVGYVDFHCACLARSARATLFLCAELFLVMAPIHLHKSGCGRRPDVVVVYTGANFDYYMRSFYAVAAIVGAVTCFIGAMTRDRFKPHEII